MQVYLRPFIRIKQALQLVEGICIFRSRSEVYARNELHCCIDITGGGRLVCGIYNILQSDVVRQLEETVHGRHTEVVLIN
jgi:hypothetical protein